MVAISVTLLSLIGRLFATGWTSVHRAIRRVESNQLVPILMHDWQETLRETTPSSWKADGKAFVSGSTSIKQEGRHLVIIRADKEKRLALPHNATCHFSIERPAGLAPYAVMLFNWESSPSQKQRISHVRFVACGRDI